MYDSIFAPAHELAGEIQRGEVSAVEVVDTYLYQIAHHNRTLNAIVTLDEEGVRRRRGCLDQERLIEWAVRWHGVARSKSVTHRSDLLLSPII